MQCRDGVRGRCALRPPNLNSNPNPHPDPNPNPSPNPNPNPTPNPTSGAPFVRRALRSFVTDYVPLTPGLSFEVALPSYHP